MSEVIIRAESLGKKYVIGHETTERYTALRDVLAQQARRLVRSARDMAAGRALIAGDERTEFWALKDINFEIRRGDIVGIVGRNGAGKSTLLKVLSRITEPTEGRVTIDGRVASLLEVGTGFHPELTGRENIYLNGAILGMTRAEIRRKFDEIVDFAGVEKFIDTPVKRYSSGMYVRLAFSVAAHLEPDILIVDEVLAVGDAEFQKKCLGKMQNVSGQGRTVLFVSHNMPAVQSLCSRGLFLSQGQVVADGHTSEIVEKYLSLSHKTSNLEDLTDLQRSGVGNLRFKCLRFKNEHGEPIKVLRTGASCIFELELQPSGSVEGIGRISLVVADNLSVPLFNLASDASSHEGLYFRPGQTWQCRIDRLPLSEGHYKLNIFLEVGGVIEDWITNELEFEVATGSFFGTPRNVPTGWEGKAVLVDHSWAHSVINPKSVKAE